VEVEGCKIGTVGRMRENKFKAQTSGAKTSCPESSGTVKESCYCNSWTEVPQSTHSGCVGIKVVETNNSKISAKQKEESGCMPVA
jgi:hypothetical protein